MYVYILKNFYNNYLEFEDELDPQYYEIGTTWDEYDENKYLKLSEEQIEYYESHNRNVSPKDVWFMTPDVESDTLISAKINMKSLIKSYDCSGYINMFTIGEDKVWLDKETRTGLKLRFEAEKAGGEEITTLWYGSKSYTLPVDMAINILYMLERYASRCYDITQQHLAAVDELTSINDVNTYDYRSGYPEQLHFEI